MFCSQCGKEIKEESSFCKYCGATQEEYSAIKEFSFEKYRKQGLRIDSKVLVGIIGVACIVLLMYVIRNYHECDWCHEKFIGDAYYDVWANDEIMCEDCAKDYYEGLGYTRFRID